MHNNIPTHKKYFLDVSLMINTEINENNTF